MTSLRSLTSALLAAALLALVGCGGGGGDAAAPAPAPGPVQVDSARTARVTLGPAGGAVVATAADGRRYTLTVPPGALAAATEISAAPVVSMGAAPLAAGLKGAVRFAPSGLRFALPATLRIEGVNPATDATKALAGFVRSEDGASMQLVPPRVQGNVIDLEVLHFSDAGVSEASAEELARVPVDAAARPEEALVDEYMRTLPLAEAANAAALIRLHDTRVAPRLTLAEFQALSTPAERETAVAVARAWVTLIVLSLDTTQGDASLPGGLAPVVTALRQRVLALLSAQFEAGRTACMAAAPIGSAQFQGLEDALRARQAVFSFRFIGGLPGLDADTAGRRLNDCVRIAFVPQPLPTFENGRPVSLDARAQLIFAADPNARPLAGYDFSVASSDATVANPSGLADLEGRYTTVVTPSAANPVFDVKACMMVALKNGGSVTTELCGRQTVAGAPTAVTLQGTVTANVVITATLRGNRNRLESFEGLLPVFDTTSESVDVTLSFDVSMPVPAGTVLQPGARTSLPVAAVSNVVGSGGVRVSSLLQARTGSCEITRLGTAATAVTMAAPQSGGGALELTSDGQLGITIGGLQGTYATTSAGSVAQTNSVGCSGTPGTFTSPFERRPVASEFMSLNEARATTALPNRGTTTGASSTETGSAFGQSSLCSLFLREHLRLLEPRLLSSEHITSCVQQTNLTWQLQRD